MSFEQYIQQIDGRRLASGVALLVLLAFYSPVMLLVLSPVYGSLPAHIFHPYGVAIFAGAGWFSKDQIQTRIGRVAAFGLPVLAFWAPTLQYFVMQQSSKLGNPLGPVITELFGYYPLVLLTVAVAGKQIQYALHLESQGDVAVEHVPLLGSYAIYSIGEHFAKAVLSNAIGFTVFFTRAGLQFVIAALYSAVIPSKMLIFAIPSLLFTITSDVHFGGISGVNSAIQSEGYSLLERQESYSGYISVLENHQDGFRVMRCDHSLLGGQWTKAAPGYRPEVEDPIYAIFAMLEAVRLVEPDHGPRVDADSKALVIGLGIGTTPAALMKHGIDTTVVELDPVVHRFATKYFNLPSNHVAFIEDAAQFVKRAEKSSPIPQYDYIVHDVFTGGSEPAELFTFEFLQSLSGLLKDDGVIAVNYAGDLNLYPTGLVVRTIQAVFPSCRIFREEAPSKDDENPDFTNMVLFCKKSSRKPLQFRDPIPADFLRSKSRESYLVPKHELDSALFQSIPKGGRRVLVAKEAGRLYKYQDRGALEHWAIMRKVVPDAVWENW